MKRLITLLMLTVISVGAYAQTDKGESSIGFNLGYGFEYDNVTLGLDYRYCIIDNVRLNPSLTHFIKNDGVSAWMIDANAHYVVPVSEMFGFYPLAGLSLSFWKASAKVDKYTLSENETRFGANIGLGAEIYASRELTVGMEVKYNIIKDMDQALIALRVGYNF